VTTDLEGVVVATKRETVNGNSAQLVYFYDVTTWKQAVSGQLVASVTELIHKAARLPPSLIPPSIAPPRAARRPSPAPEGGACLRRMSSALPMTAVASPQYTAPAVRRARAGPRAHATHQACPIMACAFLWGRASRTPRPTRAPSRPRPRLPRRDNQPSLNQTATVDGLDVTGRNGFAPLW